MLDTKRLHIRYFRPSDYRDLYEYLSCSEVYKFEPGEPVTIEQAWDIAVKRSTGCDFLAVILRGTGRMIGHLYFSQIEPTRFCTWELGYIFNPAYQRKGYASEAAKGMIDFACKFGKVHRVMARCSIENTASWKLLEKVGFLREGCFKKRGFLHRDDNGNPVWQDVYEYSMICDTL